MNIVDDTICLRASAKTTSIKGDTEPLKRLLSLMDGTRDLQGLIDALRSEFAGVTGEDVLETVEGLDSLFLLEDAAQENSTLYSLRLRPGPMAPELPSRPPSGRRRKSISNRWMSIRAKNGRWIRNVLFASIANLAVRPVIRRKPSNNQSRQKD